MNNLIAEYNTAIATVEDIVTQFANIDTTSTDNNITTFVETAKTEYSTIK